VILPRTPTLLEHYGKCSHVYFPQAHVCTLFDVLAKLPVNLAWGPNNSDERELAGSE